MEWDPARSGVLEGALGSLMDWEQVGWEGLGVPCGFGGPRGTLQVLGDPAGSGGLRGLTVGDPMGSGVFGVPQGTLWDWGTPGDPAGSGDLGVP